MAHSFSMVWIHGVFGTKNRMPLIDKTFEGQLHDHIKTYLEEDLACQVKIINGTSDHIHILFLINRELTIAEAFKRIKGESSHWINQQDFSDQKFAWQIGYRAFSVSESAVGNVVEYIRGQKEHHKSLTFMEEYENFIEDYTSDETVKTVFE